MTEDMSCQVTCRLTLFTLCLIFQNTSTAPTWPIKCFASSLIPKNNKWFISYFNFFIRDVVFVNEGEWQIIRLKNSRWIKENLTYTGFPSMKHAIIHGTRGHQVILSNTSYILNTPEVKLNFEQNFKHTIQWPINPQENLHTKYQSCSINPNHLLIIGLFSW